MQQDWQALLHECTTLTRDKESLMQNLIACQDMIREEAQVCQQQQRQLLEQAQTPQLVEGLRALPGQNEVWGGAMAGNAPMDRDSGRLFRPETGVTEVRDDGRSLRQSLDSKNTQDGGRPLWGNEFGLGQPVGFAPAPAPLTSSYLQLGDSDTRLPRVHNSHAEREPNVQARGQSVGGLDSGEHARINTELPRARVRSPSPQQHGPNRPLPLERPRYKEQEKVEVPAYPEITKLMTWKTSLATAVMIAANSPDAREIMRWVSAS